MNERADRDRETPGAPIAILSYNRPHLLASVLESLLRQVPQVAEERFHLFQDGARIEARHSPETVDACVAVFRRLCPGGVVHEAERNLGIALNFERAENYLFASLAAPVAYFFEDDMIVSEDYLRVMDVLAGHAARSDRIGHFAAYGLHRLSGEEQMAASGQVTRMHHAWGYGLTRRYWQRQRPVVEGYLGLVRGRDYKERPDREIRAYFERLGVLCYATSQDAAKRVAAATLGAARITCVPVHGKYVGVEGQNHSAESYGLHGFDRTVFYPGGLHEIAQPDEDRLAAMVCADITAMASHALLPAAEGLGEDPALHRLVASIYRGLLERDPDGSGAQAMVQAMKGGMPLHEILAGVVSSREFESRFRAAAKAALPK